jgi:signal transduction histidine kinase
VKDQKRNWTSNHLLIDALRSRTRAWQPHLKHPSNQDEALRLPTFKILLQLEWLLLIPIGFLALMISPFIPIPGFLLFNLLSVGALSLMRFKLPTQNLVYKMLYTGLELLILITPTLIDSRFRFMPFLGIVIVIRSCQMFGLLGRLIVAALVFLTFLASTFFSQADNILFKHIGTLGSSISNSSTSILSTLKLNAAFSFGLATIFVLLLINALLEERQIHQKLTIVNEQLRHYALRIEDQSALQERNRIAREIHDSLGHTLTAQSIQLDSALLLIDSKTEQSKQFLEEAKRLCIKSLQEVRQSVSTLRIAPLQGKSLEIAINLLLKEFRATTTIEPDCTIHLEQTISTDLTTTTYRILQEALTNIARHSEATRVTIQVLTRDQSLHLLIVDNGKGFEPRQNLTGFGLQGMQERTIALRGHFNLLSEPGSGCIISAQFPLVVVPV